MRISVITCFDTTDCGDENQPPGLVPTSSKVKYPQFEDLLSVAEREGVLPPHLIDLYRVPCKWDGLLHKIIYEGSSLELVIRCGPVFLKTGERDGYIDLELRYADAVVFDQENMHEIFNRTISQKIYEKMLVFELRLTPNGRIKHNFVFTTWDRATQITCFTIECKSIRWQVVRRSTRRISSRSIKYLRKGAR